MNEINTARFTLHVPMYYPDGEVVPDTEIDAIEQELLEIGSGFMRHVGIGKRGSEECGIVEESLLVYTMDVAEGPAAGASLQNLARRVGERLRQEALYLTFSALHGSFIEH